MARAGIGRRLLCLLGIHRRGAPVYRSWGIMRWVPSPDMGVLGTPSGADWYEACPSCGRVRRGWIAGDEGGLSRTKFPPVGTPTELARMLNERKVP